MQAKVKSPSPLSLHVRGPPLRVVKLKRVPGLSEKYCFTGTEFVSKRRADCDMIGEDDTQPPQPKKPVGARTFFTHAHREAALRKEKQSTPSSHDLPGGAGGAVVVSKYFTVAGGQLRGPE